MASTVPKSRGSGYHAEMDDAERASRDEIMALQTKRLGLVTETCLRQRCALQKGL